MNERHDLTRGPVGGHLRRQGLPFAVALVAIFSFDAIDLFFIARLGEAPLAAISFALPVIWLVYGIGIGFEAGAASCVSRAVGGGDEARARRLTTDTITLAVLAAIALAVAGRASIGPVFTLLGATPDLLPLIADYMRTWYWVAPLDLALWTMLASIRARGNTLLESKAIIAAALLNLALDPLLIFGLLGFPRLGVQGAALATVLATSITLAVTTAYLHLRPRIFANPFASLRVLLDSWRHVLHIGIPAMITNAIIPVSSAIVVALVATFGVDAVAGFGVAMRIEPIFLIPFYALSAVASPFFGQNFGAGHIERLQEARRVIARFCVLLGLGLALLLMLIARPLTALYSTSEAIQGVSIAYLSIAAWSWGAYGLVMSVNAAFNGIGKPMPGVVISTCRVIVVFLPLALALRHVFGLTGLFTATLVSNLLLGAVAYAWLGVPLRTAGDTATRTPSSGPPPPA
jgi:putative MATE family efflux protein